MGVKISALPSNSTPALTDVFPENHGNATYKATLSDVRDLFGIPELEDDLNDLAPAIVPTKSGNVVAFSDGADDMPIKSLAVNVEPVQDLNGYDRPWFDGCGKNLLPPHAVGTVTSNGITWTVNADGTVKANGTATANSTLYVPDNSAGIDLNNTQYIVSGCPTGGSGSSYRIYAYKYLDGVNTGVNSSDYGSGVTLDPTDGTFNQVRVALRINSGVTVTNLLFKPMLRLATEADATYEPYENVCPISGWMEANVTRTGKNLLPITAETVTKSGVTFTVNADGSVTVTGTATAAVLLDYCDSITFKAGVQYIITGCPAGGGSATANYWMSCYLTDASTVIVDTRDTGNGATFSFEEDTTLRVRIRIPNGNRTPLTFYPMIRLASITDATYEPYAGETFPVTLPTDAGTVYGGMVDPVKGKLIVDKILVTINDGAKQSGTNLGFATGPNANRLGFPLADSLGIKYETTIDILCNIAIGSNTAQDYSGASFVPCTCALYAGYGNISYFRICVPTAYTNANDAYVYIQQCGCVAVLSLATPVEYDLTPQEITTLLGYNSIYADCGSIADVEYPADTKKYIDSRLDDIESRLAAQKSIIAGVETGMTATKNYSIGDLLIVGETLYKVTAAIANGGAITVGTNVAATTVAEQLIALASA